MNNKITSVKGPLPGPRSKELFARWARVEAQCTGYQARWPGTMPPAWW